MEYYKFYERIHNVKDLPRISKAICNEYNIGNYISHKVIEIGYEDFNFTLDTSEGKYFIKILNKDREDSQCERLIKILEKNNENNVSVPKIFRVNDSSIYNLKIDDVSLRIIVMEYIDGTNMYQLNRYLTLQELSGVAEQIAKINSINYDVEEYYDEWTITNFESEYNKKMKHLEGEDKELVGEALKQFYTIDFEKLKKCYTHADVIIANLILDKLGKIWIIDFSVLNYLPRLIELGVAVFGICMTDDREETISRMNHFLKAYTKFNKLDDIEIKTFSAVFNCISAMNILQTDYIKATSEDFEENVHWLTEGRKALKMNITDKDIKLANCLPKQME